jgi:hypothetical protein
MYREKSMNVPLRDHGFYWVRHPDDPQTKVIAEWCHLGAAGRHVWFLPGDEDYRYDDAIRVISGRLSEPGSSLLSRLRDMLGMRDSQRNTVYR